MQHTAPDGTTRVLGTERKGFRGRLARIETTEGIGRLPAEEQERRLIELGFVEGAVLEVLHEGPIGRDPIAVRVGSAMVALRRSDAMAILARPD
ncbi:FeoA family protein [Maritimibacter fusiformis]|uniref:Ferrous iron transport protein A n=1 Tax=Maritimibacter fusiformis TaxID=2603819 RepID=A0A5D0RMK2_9RHOB|nr:FeoA family protein [Maritimibacter fusiformis]TYB82339.1 ferrous iron transport protein A [Maritimibacter fusiformis]